MDRIEAIEKLVDEFHLNVEERETFLDSPLLKDEVISGIGNIISQKGFYPSNWKPEIDFEGVFLEEKDEKYFAIYKAEESLAKYSVIETKEFEDKAEAARYAVEKMFAGAIDGIEIK